MQRGVERYSALHVLGRDAGRQPCAAGCCAAAAANSASCMQLVKVPGHFGVHAEHDLALCG